MRDTFVKLHHFKEHLTTIIFLGGFIFDILLLPNIDDPNAKYFAFGYITAIALLIAFREWLVSLNRANDMEQKLYAISTFGILCLLGSTLSFICIYAIRSAALSLSWPLFLILILCIMANEFVSTHNFRLTLDIGILFIALLFFSIFHTPVIMKIQNNATFIISLVIAITISLVYAFFLRFVSETTEKEAPRFYALAIGIPMFVGMLYFLNVLPAVPLSLKDSGVYHEITRIDQGEFMAQKEIDSRRFLMLRTPIFTLTPTTDAIYFFSAINAPTELSAPVSHVWEKYNVVEKRWEEKTVIPFTLAGGRADGYRAYSKKETIDEGLWRVTVKIDGKRIVGRVKFKVIKEDTVRTEEVKL